MITPNASGLYVYAIIPTSDHIIFDAAGLGAENNGHADHFEVFTIPHHPQHFEGYNPQTDSLDGENGASNQTLAAVVSASPIPDYHGLKRPDAVAFLVAHQRVVESIMRDFPTLPVKFGTVLADESQVTQLLAQGESMFHAALDKYGSRVQMEVVVLWNIQHVFKQIALDETIVQAKAQLASCLPEESMVKKISLGQQVQVALEQHRTALRGEILPALQGIAQEMVANPLMDDTMVLNVALLLDEKGCQTLDRTLADLDASFENRDYTGSSSLIFRRIGPLPPYSFTTIEVQPLSFEIVEDARRLLNLEETTTPKEIQSAYHHEVIQLHPDLHPNLPDVEANMAKLTQAYRLLTAYSESQPQAIPACCSFSRDAMSQAMLITIQRPEIYSKRFD